MPKYEIQVWKTKSNPKVGPYKIEVIASNGIDAKRIAAAREGCSESELVYCQYINDTSSSLSSTSSSADEFWTKIVLSVLKYTGIGLYKISKYLYRFITNKENQNKAKKLIILIYDFSKRTIFNKQKWKEFGINVSNKMNIILSQLILLSKYIKGKFKSLFIKNK